MSNSLQQIEIDGRSIWVEVVDLPSSGAPAPASKFANTTAKRSGAATEALRDIDITETLQTVVAPIHAALKGMAPDEVNVELTLGFGVKGNVFVAAGDANASLKVSAKWKSAGKPG